MLLLDDLITTGGAKLEAAEALRSSGVIVEHLAVLLERGATGRIDVEKEGIALHAFAHVSELLDVCERRNLLEKGQRERIEASLLSWS